MANGQRLSLKMKTTDRLIIDADGTLRGFCQTKVMTMAELRREYPDSKIVRKSRSEAKSFQHILGNAVKLLKEMPQNMRRRKPNSVIGE